MKASKAVQRMIRSLSIKMSETIELSELQRVSQNVPNDQTSRIGVCDRCPKHSDSMNRYQDYQCARNSPIE